MTNVKKKALKGVTYIHYLVQLKNELDKIQGLIDLGSEINIITSAYAKKLGFWMKKTDLRAQKIDASILETYNIVIVGFEVYDNIKKARFF